MSTDAKKNRYAPEGVNPDGYATPRPNIDFQPRVTKRTPDDPPPVEPKAQPNNWQLKPQSFRVVPDTISAADLMQIDFPPVVHLVEGLLSEGLALLCGKSKGGKSWLSLQIALCISTGTPLCGRKVVQGDVFYLALEDTRRRLKSRMQKFVEATGQPIPPNLHLTTRSAKSNEGGLYQIAEWLSAHKGTAKLVIIDTLTKFREHHRGKAAGFAEDYDAVGVIKEMCDHFGVSCLIIHHIRKLPSEDPFDSISGTAALGAAADTMLILDRVRGHADGKIYLTGRDDDECTVPVVFDKATCQWTLNPNASGIETDGIDPGTGKVGACAAWLKEFLATYAYPSDEINAAANLAGFTFDHVKKAKAKLGKDGTRDLVNKNFGGPGKNDWWSGLGEFTSWQFRPTDAPSARSAPSAPSHDQDGHKKQRARKDLGESDDGF